MRQKGFATIIIFFVIVAFIGLGYTFSKSLDKRTQSSPSISPTHTPDEKTLENWSSTVSGNIVTFSYGGSKYSFTVPVGWKTRPVCNGGFKNDKYICLISPDLKQNAVPVVEKGQLIAIAPSGSSYFVASYSKDPEDFCKEDMVSKFLSCKSIEINGQKMIKRIWSNYGFVDVAIIENNEITLTLRLEYPFPVGYKDNAFDQILSTFTFAQ